MLLCMKSLPASINTAMLEYPTGAQESESESDGVNQSFYLKPDWERGRGGGRGGDVKVEYLQLKV